MIANTCFGFFYFILFFLKCRAHIVASGSGCPWTTLRWVWRWIQGMIALCLTCSWACLPAAATYNCRREDTSLWEPSVLLQLLLLPRSSNYTLHSSMHAQNKTIPTSSLFFCLHLGKNTNKVHVLTILKGATQGVCSYEHRAVLGTCP